MTAPDLVPDPQLEERRRVAVEKAVSEARAASAHRGPEVLAVGFRCFSPGRLAVAVAGMVDDEGLARLYALTRYLGGLARDELVVDLTDFRGAADPSCAWSTRRDAPAPGRCGRSSSDNEG